MVYEFKCKCGRNYVRENEEVRKCPKCGTVNKGFRTFGQ